MKAIQHGAITTLVASILVLAVCVPTSAKDVPKPEPILYDATAPRISLDRQTEPGPLRATTVPDTTVLGSWTFDGIGGVPDQQGWTTWDATAQDGDFFHVDDFAGLGGGDFGKYYPLQGNQSVWCGARPDPNDPILCGYSTLPGYGNSWDQGWCTASCLSVQGDVTFDYIIAYYTEPGYDQVDVEYDLCDDQWVSVRNFSGEHAPEVLSDVAPDSVHSGTLRWRVHLGSDGAWSDEDGLWNTDGAILLDSLTVSDASGTLLPTELFESEAVGDRQSLSGNWASCPALGYGDFAGLFNGIEVRQEDPCNNNLTYMWGFFNGSTETYNCGADPDQLAVPKMNDDGLAISNYAVSPLIPLIGTGAHVEFNFDLYRDMPLDDLIFYMWAVRTVGPDGCPGQWQDRASVGGYGAARDWYRMRLWVSDFILEDDPGATHMQVTVGVVDMCPYWCGVMGTGACHRHSPLFDNVEVLRIDSQGPAWTVRDLDLWQDNFAGDGTTTGTVRADIAYELLPTSNPNYHPGDSVIVRVNDPEAGLAADAYTGFGSAVYAYVGVWPQGQAGKDGATLSDDTFRWPVVDSLIHDGSKWYCVRMDTVFTGSSPRQHPQPDAFCIDLRDDLFTPGDTVCFVFAATSDAPVGVTRYYSSHTGPTEDLAAVLNNPMEFTCLPTGGADILYVDHYNDRGAQPFFDTAFDILAISDQVDRYDVRAPSYTQGNGPSSRVTNINQQVLPIYSTIIWNSGTLFSGVLTDGVDYKSDDAQFLYDFISNLTTEGGLYLSGDDLAHEWSQLTGSGATTLRTQYMDFALVDGDHKNLGIGVSPLVFGESLGCFDGDSLVVDGGCPVINDFDVIDAQGAATVEASYTSEGSGNGAVLAQATVNAQAQSVGVILSGFSFHKIRNAENSGTLARADHLYDILTWLGRTLPLPTDARPTPYDYSLAQNYPNPFNPTTTVEFTVRERVRVQLSIYNVAGQLVKTLVDDERAPGIVHKIVWNGRNNAGQSVASGVYFYRLVTKGYTQTRKMVLLK